MVKLCLWNRTEQKWIGTYLASVSHGPRGVRSKIPRKTMRSFLPILSTAAAFLSIPSTHAFVAPTTTSVIGVGRTSTPERCRSSIQLSAIKQLPSTHDVSDDISTPSLQKSVISTLAAASILVGTASSAFAVSGGGLDYAGLNISEQNFSNGSECSA